MWPECAVSFVITQQATSTCKQTLGHVYCKHTSGHVYCKHKSDRVYKKHIPGGPIDLNHTSGHIYSNHIPGLTFDTTTDSARTQLFFTSIVELRISSLSTDRHQGYYKQSTLKVRNAYFVTH
jgi:hypothetical protein